MRSSKSENHGASGRKRAVVVVAVAVLVAAVVFANPAPVWLIVATVAAVACVLATWSMGRRSAAPDEATATAPNAADNDAFDHSAGDASLQSAHARGGEPRSAPADVSSFVVSLARRNGGLVDQQLALLDTLELSVEDPALLANYFKLDHLATRMRRNADSLLVLAGVDRPRVRAPQDMDEVVRAGISEIEDYRRIDVLALDHVQVTGHAATTLGHLVAELLDNATEFSPPEARVRVAGNAAPDGYEILVADSGIGISEERIVDLNRKLALPPEFGATGETTIGLTVVSMLAARIGATVVLSRSDHGGTVATVHIPTSALHGGESAEPSPLTTPAIAVERSTLTMPNLMAEPSRTPMTGPLVEASPFVEATPVAAPAPVLVPVPAPAPVAAASLPTRTPMPSATPAAAPAAAPALAPVPAPAAPMPSAAGPAPSPIEVEAANAIARLTLTVSGLPMRPATNHSDGDGAAAAGSDGTMGFWPPPALADDGAKPPPTALSNALNSLHVADTTEPRPVVEAQPDRIGAAMSSFARLRDSAIDGSSTTDRTGF